MDIAVHAVPPTEPVARGGQVSLLLVHDAPAKAMTFGVVLRLIGGANSDGVALDVVLRRVLNAEAEAVALDVVC